MSTIKNIVFDMGQVLHYYRPDQFVRDAGVAEEDLALVKRAVFEGVAWVRMDRGISAEETVVAHAYEQLPERLHEKAKAITYGWWKNELPPVPGMADVVRDLKHAGYKIYLLSNANRNLHTYFNRIPGTEYFDGKLISADHNLLKPQPDIYRKLFETFELVPEECLFVDDVAANVEAAIFCGMDGIIFRDDAKLLRKEMKKKGILIEE